MSNSKFTKPNYSGTLAIGDRMPVLKRFVARGASQLTGVDLSGCTQIEEIDLDGSERVSVVNIPQGAPLHSYVVPPSAGFNLELRGLTRLKDTKTSAEGMLGLVVKSPALIGGLTVGGCPQIDSWALALRCAKAEGSLLQQVDIEIGEVTGGIADLAMLCDKGVMTDAEGNRVSNGNVRIRGRYTVEGICPKGLMRRIGYDPEGVSDTQASSIVPGLTITIDRANAPEILLQSFDKDEEGYNPGACVLCEQKGFGTYIDSSDKSLGWYMTKQEALGRAGLFNAVSSVTDTNHILQGELAGTTFDANSRITFNEARWFQGGQYHFDGCGALFREVTIPEDVSPINTSSLCANVQLEVLNLNAKTRIRADMTFGSLSKFTCGRVVWHGSVEELLAWKMASNHLDKQLKWYDAQGNEIVFDGLPASVANSIGTTWPQSLFCDVSNVIKNIVMPNTVTTVERYSFFRATGLQSITLSDNLKSVDYYGFAYCTNLMMTELPDSIETLAYGAFTHCEKMALTRLPSNLKSLYSEAFSFCYALNLQALPTGITYVEEFVLSNGSPNLTRYDLKNVTTINNRAEYTFFGVRAANAGNRTQNGSSYCRYLELEKVTTIPCMLGYLYGGELNVHLWQDFVPTLTASRGVHGDTKVYVGDGSSKAHDDALLAQYLQAAVWSAASDKLFTWWDYLQDNPDGWEDF